jgi:hypothetical protein
MGLTLHYTLRLPSDRSRAEIFTRMEAIRARAAEQPVEYVSPVFDLSNGVEPTDSEAARARLLLMFSAEFIAEPYVEDGQPSHTGDESSTVGFSVYPGAGAEPASFALMRRRSDADGSEEWFGGGHAKPNTRATKVKNTSSPCIRR